MSSLTPPLKWHGGKHDLAKWIIGLMPPRCKNPNDPDPADPGWLHYVEPYFGGGSVLLANDPEGISEVVNDLNLELTNFWRVLQDRDCFVRFAERVSAMPFSFREWSDATISQSRHLVQPSVSDAVAFFVLCRQSLAGRMQSFAPRTRNRTRRGMNEQVSAWLNSVEGLPAIHQRLQRVLILNHDALSVIRAEDGLRTLFYLDPPYLHETRASTGEYRHEMTEVDHANLLVTLGGAQVADLCSKHIRDSPYAWWYDAKPIQGSFLLSGYRSKMYDAVAEMCGWKRHEKNINNHAAGGKTKRVMTECVWTKY